MDVGESYAYREKAASSLTEVVVRSLSTKSRSTRTKVEFIDDEYEGTIAWVPTVRLKCRWKERDEFLAREARWNVVSLRPRPEPEDELNVCEIFELGSDGLLETVSRGRYGITIIKSVPETAALLGWDESEFHESGLTFMDDGMLVVPWPTSLRMAQTILEQDQSLGLRLLNEAIKRHAEYERSVRREMYRFSIRATADLEKQIEADVATSYTAKDLASIRKLLGTAHLLAAESVNRKLEHRQELVALAHRMLSELETKKVPKMRQFTEELRALIFEVDEDTAGE